MADDNSTSYDGTGCGSEYVCSNTTTTGDNIVTAIVIDALLGWLCWVGFVLWRGFFPVYRGREVLPGVRYRPPALSLKGIGRYWNWMWPSFGINDAEFLKSAGLDALVAVRILSYGLALFLPVGALAIAILIPVNYTANGLVEDGYAPSNVSDSNLTYVFARMTMSNIPNGSALLWIHFVFLFCAVAYGCWLITLYYEENISLQHSMFSSYINDLKKGIAFDLSSGAQITDGQGRPQSAALQRILGESGIDLGEDTAKQLEEVAENLEEGSVNRRVAKMMDPSNDNLLAQAFRQTVQKPKKGQLWPVKRPTPFTASRPEFAGRYAVLVVDEPRKRFRQSATVRMMRRSKSGVERDEKKLKKDRWWANIGGFFSTKSDPVDDTSLDSDGTELDRSQIPSPSESAKDEAAEAVSSSVSKDLHMTENHLTDRKVRTGCCGMVKEREEAFEAKMTDRKERIEYIERTFIRLFGDDFHAIVPVYSTEKIDALIARRWQIQAKAARVEWSIEFAEGKQTKYYPWVLDFKLPKDWSKSEANESKRQKQLAKLRDQLATLQEKDAALDKLVAEEKEQILMNPACASFIAVFHSAMAAATASNLNANPLSWRGFHCLPCPDPENINYPAVTTRAFGRAHRTFSSLFFIILVMVFPLGIFTGAASQLETAICGAPEDATASASGSWICSDDFWAKLIMGILTGLLPQLLLTIYQSVFLPIYVMFCAQAERKHVSLSKLDLRCAQLFFHWNVWNFFFGSMLGGTFINGLREAVKDPSSIVSILGNAVPAASNYFINYVILRALTMTMFRLFWPHACLGMNIAQWFYVMPKPKTPMDFARANPLRNCRFSRDLSISVLTIFVASMTYSIISPFILVWTMIYFCLMYMVRIRAALFAPPSCSPHSRVRPLNHPSGLEISTVVCLSVLLQILRADVDLLCPQARGHICVDNPLHRRHVPHQAGLVAGWHHPHPRRDSHAGIRQVYFG